LKEKDDTKCHIANCDRQFVAICDESLGYFNFEWKACGIKICEDHKAGHSRCHGLPMNECEKSFIIARRKKRAVYSIIFLAIVTVLTLVVYIVHGAL
jgi:hypothetical protein